MVHAYPQQFVDLLIYQFLDNLVDYEWTTTANSLSVFGSIEINTKQP